MYQESNPMIQPQHPDLPSSRSPYQSLHQVHPLPQHMVNPPQQLSAFADPQNGQIIPDLSQQQQFNANYMPQALVGQSMGVINQYNSMQPQYMGNAYQQPSAFSDPQNAQMNPDLSQQQPLNGSYVPQAMAGQSTGMINPENSMQPQHMGNSFQQPSTFSDPQNAQMNPDLSQQQPLNGSYIPQALAGQSMGVMQPMQTVVNIPEELITGKERIKSGWERLEERDGIFIEQKKETIEILRTERVRSDYSIYGLSVDGERRGKKIYKGRELHSGRDEFCMTKGCSFFELKINLADGDDEKTPFLYITRPSSCTCLCFGRPGLKVSYVENGKNLYLGRIKDTFGFCSIVLQIFDEDNSLKYTIEAWSCQCGLMFDCPMDCCHDVGFYIRDGMGKTLATMEKKRQGCTAPKMDRKNNFAVRFPEKASKEDKALIMAAAFLLDYRYFNDN